MISKGDSPLPKPVRSAIPARNRRDLADRWVREVMRHWAALAIALVLSAAASAPAGAETINMVAFGDSGVFGSGQGRTHGGVPVAEAYPAKLERALRARGWDVSVSNQGVRGATARNAVYTIDRSIPPLTKLTIIQFGSNDRNLLLTSAGDIAQSLEEIIRKVRVKGSAVILVRQWPPSDAAAFAAVEQSADASVTWYSDVYYEGKLRPEYDSGDHAHLNAAGTDVIVARAVPDVERLLMRLGSRPSR
jgi:acyl-CoA thioesterase-1